MLNKSDILIQSSVNYLLLHVHHPFAEHFSNHIIVTEQMYRTFMY